MTTKRKTKAKWSRYTLKRKFGGRWYGLARLHAYGEGKNGTHNYYARNDAFTKAGADAEVKYWRAKGISARKVKVKDGWLVYRKVSL